MNHLTDYYGAEEWTLNGFRVVFGLTIPYAETILTRVNAEDDTDEFLQLWMNSYEEYYQTIKAYHTAFGFFPGIGDEIADSDCNFLRIESRLIQADSVTFLLDQKSDFGNQSDE
ncbi:hypothetical protein [Spirosoma sp.]|uniref:hypothetical protein n=1 Tax=Spirosoma sp. TaxID=1899569 RepID=UPI00262F8825|nr:hypothetical protein [Spirosoma sp.]MCX6217668.1 hypothetical protein [Spirosoma sp.]